VTQRSKKTPENDRMPPSSLEAEQGILGCVMLCPGECLDECRMKLKAGPEVFFDIRHQTLYRELLVMERERGGVMDLVTIPTWLKDRRRLEECGGLAYVCALSDSVHSAAGIGYYLDIVLEKYLVRKIIQTCTSLCGEAFENVGDIEGMIQSFEGAARRIRDDAAAMAAQTVKPLTATAHEVIDDWQHAFQHPGELTGVPTSLADLDEMTSGWQKEHLIIIGGRPSQGKTALILQFAAHAAVRNQIPTLLFSLESSAKECVKRILCNLSATDQTGFRRGKPRAGDFDKVTPMVPRVTGSPLYIIDTPGLSISQVQAITREHFRKHQIKLACLDYVQKVRADNKQEKRTYEVAQVTEGLKTVAREIGIPFIAAAQLNREPDKVKEKGGREPRLSDLGDSGQIERDADVVGLLYHWTEEENTKDETRRSALLIAKMRDAPIGAVDLYFQKEFGRFENAGK